MFCLSVHLLKVPPKRVCLHSLLFLSLSLFVSPFSLFSFLLALLLVHFYFDLALGQDVSVRPYFGLVTIATAFLFTFLSLALVGLCYLRLIFVFDTQRTPIICCSWPNVPRNLGTMKLFKFDRDPPTPSIPPFPFFPYYCPRSALYTLYIPTQRTFSGMPVSLLSIEQ